MTGIAVLVRLGRDTGPPPEARPVGRAALAAAREGIRVIFTDVLRAGHASGSEPEPGGWRAVDDVPVAACYDRYPSFSHREGWLALLRDAAGLPVGNPPDLTELCRDKAACQRVLEAAGLPVPPQETRPERFGEALAAWGAGFLKPRHGTLGAGVRRVVRGDPLLGVEGTEPILLQRAVPPPPGAAGISVRVLVQRREDGGWTVPSQVLRWSPDDPVANAARGAVLRPVDDALPGAGGRLADLAVAAAEALGRDRPTALELGVDVVPDARGDLWVIEVNAKPLGRLEGLATLDPGRFAGPHLEACVAPLRRLATLVARG